MEEQQKVTSDSTPLTGYLQGAIDHIRSNEFDEARKELINIDSIAQVSEDYIAQASAYSNFGWLYSRLELRDSALYYYLKSIEINTSKLKDTARLIRDYRRVAGLYRDEARFSEAASVFEEAYGLANSIKDSLSIASASLGLGNVLLELEERNEAIRYYDVAIEMWKGKRDMRNYSIALQNKADALIGMKSIEKSLSIMQLALRIKDSLKREGSKAFTLTSLGRAYTELDSLDKAEEYLNKALEIRKRINNKPGQAETLFRLGIAERRRKRYDRAEEISNRVVKMSEELKKPDLLRDVFEEQRTLYKAWGKLRELAEVDEVYDIMTDSLYREEKLKVQEAQSAASLQREQQKTILAEQGVRLANLELESANQKSQFRLMLAIVAMLGILVIAWQLLQIRKRNAELVTLNSRIKLITDNAFHSQKNALGLISALLRSKARQTEHEKELEVLKDVEGKIEALGGVAKSLFQRRIEDNTAVAARVQLKSYLEELVDDTFSSVASKADLDLSVEDIETTSTEALNIGLITNEAVTNFSKYAEPAGADTLLIRVTKEGETLHLSFTDNGPGFPDDFDFSSSTGFGMQMMANLVEDMDGKIDIKREDELTLIEVEIPLKA